MVDGELAKIIVAIITTIGGVLTAWFAYSKATKAANKEVDKGSHPPVSLDAIHTLEHAHTRDVLRDIRSDMNTGFNRLHDRIDRLVS